MGIKKTSEKRGSKMEPRYQYDCVFCKFNWNCGPVCACNFKTKEPILPEPPKEVKIWVNNTRKRHGYEPEFIIKTQ